MDSNHHKQPTTHTQNHKPSSTNLLSSAKVVAEAAKASLNHETHNVDKGKVAGAAADLLDAAEHYGKLEKTSFGAYFDKAENYLHQYHSSHSSTTTTNSSHSTTHSTSTTHGSSTNSHSHASGDGHSESQSGYGEYFKMAEGFLKKH